MRSWPIGSEALGSDPQADPFGPKGKAQVVVQEQDENSAEWCLVDCDFISYKADDAIAMLNAVGLPLTLEDYELLGKRVWNLVRLFNLREGWTAADDRIPTGLQAPLKDSGRSLQPEVFAAMLADYYSLRGWDESGRPSAELVARLGLEEYVHSPATSIETRDAE
jgi:aldehyde:ferredoxin oxidoreductase